MNVNYYGLQLIPNQKNIIISFGRDLKSVKSLSFFTNDDDKENYPGKVVPVLMYYATEKGSMGCWFVETEGEDFDPKKVAYSTVCTNIQEVLDTVWYDKEELWEQDEWKSTNGKGLYASVGWMNLNWHDTKESRDIDDYWEYFDE